MIHLLLSFHLEVRAFSLGVSKQVAEHYQKRAVKNLADNGELIKRTIKKLKEENREKEIESTLRKIKPKKVNKKLAYLEGKDLEDYLHDIKIVQNYASYNRLSIALCILNHLKLTSKNSFDTIHNYIDTNDKILRKDAISAKRGEILLIPINMRDGAILAVGKGNPDWNYSAPHGAGRLLSRSKAKEKITIDEFEESMKDVYSTSVREGTIDESPFAYKNIDEIIENTKDTIEIKSIIKPIYNFKA